MNRKILITYLALLITVNVFAQKIDYNKIILPSSVKDVSIEERLVQIAWDNHPSVNIAENNEFIAEKRLIREKSGWLELIRIQGNLNEFTIDPDPANPRSTFFPRYNFGITFTLGTFSTIPLDVKMARASLKNQEETINGLKLQIRAQVLSKYYDYKANLDMFNMQKQSLAETEAQYKLVETKFRNGETMITEFNAAKDRYDAQRLKLITIENSYMQSKINLEEVIGMSLEGIL
jgi:outer membrane protein TolC